MSTYIPESLRNQIAETDRRRCCYCLTSEAGSGHKSMHGGFVGVGMLDAACPGEMFTSPTPDQMLEAAKMVNGGARILNIVKNYSSNCIYG